METIQLFRIDPIVADVGTNVTTVTGNGLLLRCNASGIPAPRIDWRKDGLLRKSGSADYIIPSLAMEDSGLYTCSASNVLGSVKESSNIDVIGNEGLPLIRGWGGVGGGRGSILN